MNTLAEIHRKLGCQPAETRTGFQYITFSVAQLSKDNSIRYDNGVKDAVDMEH